MTEMLASRAGRYRQSTHDHFAASAFDRRLGEHQERGLAYTNNLSLHVRRLEDQQTGRADSEVLQPTYGHDEALLSLRTEAPDAWQRSLGAMVRYNVLRDEADTIVVHDEASQQRFMTAVEMKEEAYWLQAEALDELYVAASPSLETANIDPIDLCV